MVDTINMSCSRTMKKTRISNCSRLCTTYVVRRFLKLLIDVAATTFTYLYSQPLACCCVWQLTAFANQIEELSYI